MNLEVEVPNTDTTLPFQAYQVDKIKTTAAMQKEVKTFTITGENQPTAGKLELKVVRYKGLNIDYQQSVNITYGCTANDFLTALKNFDSYKWNYYPSATRIIYDANDNVITTLTGGLTNTGLSTTFCWNKSLSVPAEGSIVR